MNLVFIRLSLNMLLLCLLLLLSSTFVSSKADKDHTPVKLKDQFAEELLLRTLPDGKILAQFTFEIHGRLSDSEASQKSSSGKASLQNEYA